MDNYAESMPISEVTLERVKFGLRKELSEHFAKELDDHAFRVTMVDVMRSDIMEGVRVLVTGTLLGDDYPKEFWNSTTVEHYASWWDHFKDSWFPAWAKSRWPVCHRKQAYTVRVRVRPVYPKLQDTFPNRGPVRFHITQHESMEKHFGDI